MLNYVYNSLHEYLLQLAEVINLPNQSIPLILFIQKSSSFSVTLNQRNWYCEVNYSVSHQFLSARHLNQKIPLNLPLENSEKLITI